MSYFPESYDYGGFKPSQAEEGFEGPEKRLEVNFFITENPLGLRAISREKWQSMLDLARCTILSCTSNDYLDSYVLSESSLFVYPFKVIIKTCGTTTLLNCLDKLEEFASECGSKIELVLFSRKNYNFPAKQQFPHCNFQSEVAILADKFPGSAHILGPVFSGGDHHFIYLSDHEELASSEEKENQLPTYLTAPSLELLMSNLDDNAMKHFYRDSDFIDAKTTTQQTGLATILPEMKTDEFMFEPCGYSVNAIGKMDNSYFTVHVTPESHCSFVSFETNHSLCLDPKFELVQKVANIFRPGRMSLVLSSGARTFFNLKAYTPDIPGYIKRYRMKYDFEGGFKVVMCNYVLASQPRLGALPLRGQLSVSQSNSEIQKEDLPTSPLM